MRIGKKNTVLKQNLQTMEPSAQHAIFFCEIEHTALEQHTPVQDGQSACRNVEMYSISTEPSVSGYAVHLNTKHGRKVGHGGIPGRAHKVAKGLIAAVARSQRAINAQLDELEQQQAAVASGKAAQQQQQEALNAHVASIAKREKKLARDIETTEARQQKRAQREQDLVSKAAAAAIAKQPALSLQFIDDSVEKLKPKTGEIATQHQSRIILMLYFDLVKVGCTENQAKRGAGL